MSRVKTEIGVKSIATDILAQLEPMGCREKIISVKHVAELQQIYADHRASGRITESFRREWLNGFDFQLPERLPQGSIILIAVPQREQKVTFRLSGRFAGRELSTIIPPTYHHGVDEKLREVLRERLASRGFRLLDTSLPKKLLAVCSGLARYARNNITYIPGMGSYFRLVLFASDLPTTDDVWQEPQAMERCAECTACLKSCPTGAISEDRFLLHAERCLTYHNERNTAFPDWIDPGWHHCLVGCLRCQWNCPENKPYRDRIELETIFSADETLAILGGKAQGELSGPTLAKLGDTYLLDYFEQLPRNLRALLRKEIHNAGNPMA